MTKVLETAIVIKKHNYNCLISRFINCETCPAHLHKVPCIIKGMTEKQIQKFFDTFINDRLKKENIGSE
jgi:hypothetical protein